MIKFVNAKINIGLRVLRRRADGYHDLSTLFYPVGKYAGTPLDNGRMCDILEVTRDTSDSLEITGLEVDCAVEDNLVWRALQQYRSLYGALPPVRMRLHKQLPSQAGLGGGSADATAALQCFNEMCGNPFPFEVMCQAALQLGADCPFFLINSPCLATGVGEKIEAFDVPLAGLWAAILKPSVGISTAQAFKYVSPAEPDIDIKDILRMPVQNWRELLVNDFETSMFREHPQLRYLKDYLYGCGALYASMSGSGSAFYGIFHHKEQALAAVAGAEVPYSSVALL